MEHFSRPFSEPGINSCDRLCRLWMINRPHIVQLQCSTSSSFACAAVSFICKINTKDGKKQERMERGWGGNIDTIFGHRIVPFLHYSFLPSFLPSLTSYTVSQPLSRLIPLWHPQRKGSRINMKSYRIWPKRFVLGCVNSHPRPGRGITQPSLRLF